MEGYQLEEIFSFRNVVTYALICMLIYELLWLFLVVMDFFFKSISSAISGEPVKDFEAAEYIKYGIISNIYFLFKDVITGKVSMEKMRKQIGIAARMAFGKAIEIVKDGWQSKR